jgi:hypothetical protein
LRDFDGLNFYIVSRSVGERGYFDYVKSTVLSQECTVTEFGKSIYFKVVHEGQSVVLNSIFLLRKEKPGRFPLNMVLDIFRHLDPINLRNGIEYMDGRITYVRDSIAHSKFICNGTQNQFLTSH